MAGLPTVKASSVEIKSFFARGLSKREIAKRLKVGRTSVHRVGREGKKRLYVFHFANYLAELLRATRRPAR
jgi:DNA invertase Pin-like site-specific DNA recombinase